VAISERAIYRQVVEVEWDDTIQAMVEKVKSRFPDNPLQAYVWLRHPEGGYALASMFDLDERAWGIGYPILKMQVREFPVLFPRQPGVERGGPLSENQAKQEANKYSGRLLIVDNGAVLGCIRGNEPTRGARPTGAFRLDDKPLVLKRDLSASTRFAPYVSLTYDTSVAFALDKLQSLQTRELPFVIFPDPYHADRWFAFSERELGLAVSREDKLGTWALAHLGDYNPRTCQAVAYEEVGEQQANELCSDRQHRCLVIIHKDEVLLLVPDPTLRSATKGVSPVASGEPSPVRSSVPPTVPVEPGARYVNLWFEESSQKIASTFAPAYGQPKTPLSSLLPKGKSLVEGQAYDLCVTIGRHEDKSIVAWEKEVRPPPIVEPPEVRAEKEAKIYVSVFSMDFDVAQPTQLATLPPRGSSETVKFAVQPMRRTFGEKDLARLDVCLYYRCNLVQSFEVQVEILPRGEDPHTDGPQRAELKVARVEAYPELDQLTPKQLTLTITKKTSDSYQFTFTVSPESVESEGWDKVRLGCHVDLTRDELTHLVTKARRQLYNVVRVYRLIQGQDRETCAKALRALAEVGRQLHRKLFRTDAAKALHGWMAKHVPPGSTIQVVDRAGDFVLPWSLIYEGKPWGEEIDKELFWGWRYKLAISTDMLASAYGKATEQIETSQQLKILVGLYARLHGAREQNQYFKQLGKLPDSNVNLSIVDSSSTAVQELQTADQHLIYFFCHGYTEKMANDIQLGDDLVRQFTESAAEELEALTGKSEQDQEAALREHLSDLFDISDSWMRLTRGKIPLTMLEDELEEVTFSEHPLVFLNMCQSAQVLPSLSGGLIPFFIEKGARAVIGTECSMNMVFGDRFSQRFWDLFLKGRPAAEIVWQLRRESLEGGDPLGLAYTLFGDADLRLVPLRAAGAD
jgi:hypothetical protein